MAQRSLSLWLDKFCRQIYEDRKAKSGTSMQQARPRLMAAYHTKGFIRRYAFIHTHTHGSHSRLAKWKMNALFSS